MPKVRNKPPLAGPASIALGCVIAIFGSSLVFSGPAPPSGTEPQPEMVVEIRIRGHEHVPVEKIIRHIHIRANRPYDPETVQEDIRRLHRTRLRLRRSGKS